LLFVLHVVAALNNSTKKNKTNQPTNQPIKVKLALLTAATKLFFARPPECKALLGSLFQQSLAGDLASCPDVHDRALLYYRLLRTDVEAAKRVVLAGSSLPFPLETASAGAELPGGVGGAVVGGGARIGGVGFAEDREVLSL
jgi:hypothetical protein